MRSHKTSDSAPTLDGFNPTTGTFGLVLDLTLPKTAGLVRRLVKNTEALKTISAARATQYRWVAVAGRLHAKRAGCLASLIPDAELLPLIFVAFNERLAELGAPHTIWAFSVEPEQEAVLRAEAARRMATVGGVQ